MQTTFLELRDLAKSYGRREAVKGISLSVPRGQVLGLLGPNGAGKSTTISMLTGLLSPTAGEILWEGRPIRARMQEWRRSIGAVLEELSLFEYLTVREHLVLTGRLAGLDAGETERRVEELLDFFDLADHAGTVASEASQGTRKKLAFALGLVHSPSLLLLDEAFNGIDAVTVSRVKGLLSRLAGRGVTVIMSSHILDSAQTVIQRCVIVDRGALILDASMESILRAGRSLEQVYTEAISGASRPLPELSWV